MLDIESSALIDLLREVPGNGGAQISAHLEEIKEECESSGKSAMEVIENFGIFTKPEMLQIMADSLGTYIWNPKSQDLPREIIKSLEVDIARTYGVIPISDDGVTVENRLADLGA